MTSPPGRIKAKRFPAFQHIAAVDGIRAVGEAEILACRFDLQAPGYPEAFPADLPDRRRVDDDVAAERTVEIVVGPGDRGAQVSLWIGRGDHLLAKRRGDNLIVLQPIGAAVHVGHDAGRRIRTTIDRLDLAGVIGET